MGFNSDPFKFVTPLLKDVFSDIFEILKIETSVVLLLQSLSYYAKSWLPARSIVAESLAARMEAHESGEIMILKQFCPV